MGEPSARSVLSLSTRRLIFKKYSAFLLFMRLGVCFPGCPSTDRLGDITQQQLFQGQLASEEATRIRFLKHEDGQC